MAEKIVAFRKTKEPYGWLGNMSAHPVVHNGLVWKTTEALFQALRFSDPIIREEIRKQTSPMGAKMFAKARLNLMTVKPQSAEDLDNMRLVIRLKIEQHLQLRSDLLATGDAIIIENCTSRQHGSGLFWGAALIECEWKGENVLGKLWMELRNSL